MASVRLTQSAKEIISSTVSNNIIKLRGSYPFPVKLKDIQEKIYIPAIPADLRPHVLALLNSELEGNNFLNLGYHQTMRINSDTVMYPLGGHIPTATGPITVNSEHPMYCELSQWATDATTLDSKLQRVLDTVEYVLGFCNTGGQVRLAWPELTGLLPETVQVKLEGTIARVMPQLPQSNTFYGEWEYASATVLRERITEATDTIATGNLMPTLPNDMLWR